MFPLFLIVGMSWAVFWIDSSKIAPPIGTATVSMLTLIAYRFALGGLIPKVSYFTRMDSFITASTLLVFLALLVAILTGKLAKGEHG
jgi:VIT1/CCC1 family predicted Fe2+/Mn2+ transporter